MTELEKLRTLKKHINLRTIATETGIDYFALAAKVRKPKQSLTEEQAAAVRRVLAGISEVVNEK
jgi:hypothetical protein